MTNSLELDFLIVVKSIVGIRPVHFTHDINGRIRIPVPFISCLPFRIPISPRLQPKLQLTHVRLGSQLLIYIYVGSGRGFYDQSTTVFHPYTVPSTTNDEILSMSTCLGFLSVTRCKVGLYLYQNLPPPVLSARVFSSSIHTEGPFLGFLSPDPCTYGCPVCDTENP